MRPAWRNLELSAKIIVVFLAVVVLFFVGQGIRFVAHSATCQEDQKCWDCDTMGNRVCGDVEVNLYNTTSDNQYVEIYDEHNKQVFLARIEKVNDERDNR